jgi:ribosomal-protein-alanine N-acetyltransferase
MRVERAAYASPWPREVFEGELERAWAFVDVLRPRLGAPIEGFVNYWLVRDEVHLLNVATHPDVRRRGWASRLVENVLGFARDHGCAVVTLEVRRSNTGAMRLYRRYGFRPVGVRPGYYAPSGSAPAEDAVVMLLDLDVTA